MKIVEAEILEASILIVDDQESNVLLLQQLLAESGYTRVAATNLPQDVFLLQQKNDYDLILLDMQMPGMDGFAVMEALKAIVPDDYLPVIVLTAQPDLKLRALQAGARDFVSKPYDLLEVRTRIRNMLEVRMLYRRLAEYSRELERRVAARTAELSESEARFRRLTELASDWYWEQDERGDFTRTSGQVMELLGFIGPGDDQQGPDAGGGWNESEREALRETIVARQPFLDFFFSRQQADGRQQSYRVSGEPMFNESGSFVGYRGVGVECSLR